jgi:hypothetical protein
VIDCMPRVTESKARQAVSESQAVAGKRGCERLQAKQDDSWQESKKESALKSS